MSAHDQGANAWHARPFTSAMSPQDLSAIQRGVMQSRYRGIPMYKSPFDIALYLQLFSRLEPRTVIEVGTRHGGSALFFADLMRSAGVDGRVLTIDTNPAVEFEDDGIEVLTGDACHLGGVVSPDRLRALVHPVIVIEDSAHTYDATLSVLQFFASHLQIGDYLIVEDGIVSQLPGDQYRQYEDGPNRAVRAFLSERSAEFEVDTDLCDMYGYNATYNPNGWLRRRRRSEL